MQKPVSLTLIPSPPQAQRIGRNAAFAEAGAKRDRYTLPDQLASESPVGYRTRPSLTAEEARLTSGLFSLEPPTAFVPGTPVTEGELFEEAALGVLTSRQSTNFRGHRQITLGPADSAQLVPLLEQLEGCERPVLGGAAYTHVGFSRPYRTPFTFLLTFVGHKTVASLFTVPKRAWQKKFHHADDIPTVGFLQHLHVGIWADSIERAAVIASNGTRQANVWMQPFSGPAWQEKNAQVLSKIEALVGLTGAERREGWRVCLIAEVGTVATPLDLGKPLCRKLGATLMSLRSERIQPGVNAEEKAPNPYQSRQDMDVPDELVEMAGRAAYNAFCHWTGIDREAAKALLLLERIDVLTDGGKERLRSVRRDLEDITDQLVSALPLWADLPLLRSLSTNAARGKKAFALAGQRIYVGGLSRAEVQAAGLDFAHAVRAFGAASARSALVCELSGCIDIPAGCDLLAGVCLMAGPVNQNDVGKQFHGYADLLAGAFPGRDPTSLLVWTLKAKTVADPIGNEEQLMNASRKGALVDLRSGPPDIVGLLRHGKVEPMRSREGRSNSERAFHDVGNFVTDAAGKQIPGNCGSAWPMAWRQEHPWG